MLSQTFALTLGFRVTDRTNSQITGTELKEQVCLFASLHPTYS